MRTPPTPRVAAAEYGVGTGEVSVDMATVKARKDKIVRDDREGVESWLNGMDGCTFIRGHARFEGPHTIRVDDRVLDADKIFLNVGGRAVAPDMPGLSDIDYMTNVGVLELDTVPEHLIIVGGSYIGLEFAQMYRRFGAQVTVIEKGPRLISREDEDVSAAIKRSWRPKASTCASTPPTFASPSADSGFDVIPREGAHPIAGSHLLMAVGRRPNTDDLGSGQGGRRDRRARLHRGRRPAAHERRAHLGDGRLQRHAARSRTRRTTTSRSSRRICSTTTRAGSATGSPPTRSTSIRRWAGPG